MIPRELHTQWPYQAFPTPGREQRFARAWPVSPGSPGRAWHSERNSSGPAGTPLPCSDGLPPDKHPGHSPTLRGWCGRWEELCAGWGAPPEGAPLLRGVCPGQVELRPGQPGSPLRLDDRPRRSVAGSEELREGGPQLRGSPKLGHEHIRQVGQGSGHGGVGVPQKSPHHREGLAVEFLGPRKVSLQARKEAEIVEDPGNIERLGPDSFR